MTIVENFKNWCVFAIESQSEDESTLDRSVLHTQMNICSYLPGPSRRLAPVIKCRRFLSFFQRYIVRDIALT